MPVRLYRPARRRARQRIAAGVACIGLGAAAVLLLGIHSRSSTSAPAARNQTVLVAARDLANRTPIMPEDVALVSYYADDVPPGALLSLDAARGQAAAVDILKGQPLTFNALTRNADELANPHPAYLPVPSGFVAVTVPTSEQTGVGGYIHAGDYIALVAIVPGGSGQNVHTVFDNVHVIKVGAAPQGSSGAGPSANQGGLSGSLTLVVTSCQAELINWFLVNAFLAYELESFRDYQPRDAQIDPSCPSVTNATGVSLSDVSAHWPGIEADLSAPGASGEEADALHPIQSVGCGSNNNDTRPSACGG